MGRCHHHHPSTAFERCRSHGRGADASARRVCGRRLSEQAGQDHRGGRLRRPDRRAGALASQIISRTRPAGRGREPAWRRRRHRRAGGRKRGARRLHAAHGQHQHVGGDSGGVAERRLRSGEEFHSDREDHRGFQILVVHPSSPWKTVKEFVDYTKANPGKINYAHTGAGGLPHLAGELFMLRSGAKMTGVAYRSGGESSNAVLGQAVHATLENIAILAR